MNLSKFLVFIFGLALPLSSADCAHVESNVSAYQYVKLFGGDFPIPLRFELIAWSDKSLEYSSPAPLGKPRGMEMSKYGFITVGLRDDLINEEGKKPLVTPIASCGALEVSRITPKEMREDLRKRFPPVFRITSKNYYLTITDADEHLWRELVLVFAENLQIPSSQCQI